MPHGSCKADELALDLDSVMETALQHPTVTEEQRRAVREVGSLFETMSKRESTELWTEEAVLRDPMWEQVRQLAVRALECFGWQEE